VGGSDQASTAYTTSNFAGRTTIQATDTEPAAYPSLRAAAGGRLGCALQRQKVPVEMVRGGSCGAGFPRRIEFSPVE